MRLAIPEDARLLADMAARFLRDAATPHHATAPDALWRQMAEMGWLALPIRPDHGGLGADSAMLAALMEVFGRFQLNAPYLPSVIMGAGLLSRFEGPVVHALLADSAAGSFRLAVAVGAELSAGSRAGAWVLDGTAKLVLGGVEADLLLLPATLPGGGLGLFAAPVSVAGLTLNPIITLDGRGAADLTCASLCLDRASLLAERGVAEALDWMLDRAASFAGAEAVGAITALLDATASHTATRSQFGRPLQKFQVVEHFLADMLIGAEAARAACQLALTALSAPTPARHRAVSAAKYKIGQIGRSVAQTAIQLHGAMGMTAEMPIGEFAKRLLGFDALFGTNAEHLARYTAGARDHGWAAQYLSAAETLETPQDDLPNLALGAGHLEFRAGIRAFLDANLPAPLARAQRLTATVYPEADIARAWHKVLHKAGRSAPHWPAAFGGPGWDAVQRYIWAQECAIRDAPIISPIGLSLVGPVLFEFGTKAQQARFLPPILAGDELWCQGFSEPGAGSDLSALATRAVRDGDDYIVNGTKIWTTHGHVADYMAALVRTGPAGGRRHGISFLMIDMRAPGVKIQPIVTIGGDHELNQVFFDDVRVPVWNLVGLEGQGWDIAKYLLAYERGGDIMSGGHRALLRDIHAEAERRHVTSPEFWHDFARAAIDVDILEMLELRAWLAPEDTNHASASILKLRASASQQAVTELGLSVLGPDMLRWQTARPPHLDAAAQPPDMFAARYLNSRANSIFGGAREIQKGIIAKTILAV